MELLRIQVFIFFHLCDICTIKHAYLLFGFAARVNPAECRLKCGATKMWTDVFTYKASPDRLIKIQSENIYIVYDIYDIWYIYISIWWRDLSHANYSIMLMCQVTDPHVSSQVPVSLQPQVSMKCSIALHTHLAAGPQKYFPSPLMGSPANATWLCTSTSWCMKCWHIARDLCGDLLLSAKWNREAMPASNRQPHLCQFRIPSISHR